MLIEQSTKPNDLTPDHVALELTDSVESLLNHEPRAGDPCPNCKIGRLDYDGLLNLGCQQCGFALAGCST